MTHADNPHHVIRESQLVPYQFTHSEASRGGLGRVTDETVTYSHHYYAFNRDVVTIDGTHFHLQYLPPDKLKDFRNYFSKLTHPKDAYSRRLWYIQCVTHCRTYGIYLPPWVTVHKTVHKRGFNFGDDEDFDLPDQLKAYCNRWTTQICDGILQKHPDVQIPDRNGYNFMCNSVQRDHPIFLSFPENLTLVRPKQRPDETTINFLYRYQDFVNCCGLVEDIDRNLTKTTELNAFITRTLHGPHVHKHIAFDRQNPDNQHKYTVEQIANTIDQVLEEHPPKKYNPYAKKNRQTPTSINGLSTRDDDDSINDQHDDDSISISPSTVPFDEEVLEVAINAIRQTPSLATNRPCIVCKIINPENCDHSFSECKFLKNHPHCRSMYIKAMSLVNSILKEQQKFLKEQQKFTKEDKDKTINALRSYIEERTQDFPSQDFPMENINNE